MKALYKTILSLLLLYPLSAMAQSPDRMGVVIDLTNCQVGQAPSFVGVGLPLGCVGVPTASGLIPSSGYGLGTAGSAGTYIPGNAAPRLMVQRTTVLTNSNGEWSVAWNTPFASSSPIVTALPLNPVASVPYNCNILTRTSNGATGECWQLLSQTVALLGLTISLASSNAPQNTNVMIIGAEPTQ